MEQLRGRVGGVEQLRDEQQQQRLAEVAEDADDGEDHAGEVAVRVADEDARRVPVVVPERQRDADEGEQEVEREEVGVGGRVRVGGEGGEVEEVVEGDEEGDHDGLGDFDAVDAGEDVDRIGAEDGEGSHVGVV